MLQDLAPVPSPDLPPAAAALGLIVRQATSGDAPALRALWRTALATHPSAFAASVDEAGAESVAAFVERLGREVVFGGWLGCELVAMAGFARPSLAKKRHKGILWGVYVCPSARGLGVGRAVVSAVIAHARTLVAQLHAAVVATNRPARRLYDELGFCTYGIEPASLRHDGQDYDQVLMVLRFDGQG